MSTCTNILVVQLEHILAPAETFAGYNAEKTSVLCQYLASDKKTLLQTMRMRDTEAKKPE